MQRKLHELEKKKDLKAAKEPKVVKSVTPTSQIPNSDPDTSSRDFPIAVLTYLTNASSSFSSSSFFIHGANPPLPKLFAPEN